MKKHLAYPSKYLKAADFPEPIVVTISHVIHDAMADGERKPVVFFHGFDKGCVVNATNADTLYALARTDDDEDWPELSVEVYTVMATFPGRAPGPAIRFRNVGERRRATSPSPATLAKPRRPKSRVEEPPPHTSLPEDLDDEIPY